MGKYDALYHFLKQIQHDKDEITFTFDEMEKIIGFKLPQSAYNYRQWWANPTSPEQHPYAQSWLLAGWIVDSVDQQFKWVRFKRSKKIQSKQDSAQVLSGNRMNPEKGLKFQEKVAKLFSKRFQVDFQLDYSISIGNPPKGHKFDLVSSDLLYVGECKNHSWTESGNVPSAKMGFVNEAAFYLSFLSKDITRFIVMRKDVHPKKSETLAEYYYRTYQHLLQGIIIFEVDLEEEETIKMVGSVS